MGTTRSTIVDRAQRRDARARQVATGLMAAEYVALCAATAVTAAAVLFAAQSRAPNRIDVVWTVVLHAASFHAVAWYWRIRQWTGETWLLPIAHLLTGVGLAAMVALQDPARERLLAMDFAIGVALGAVALAVASSWQYRSPALPRLAFVPLAGAALLSVLLIVFGSGPGASDAKVNLLGMQPVEVIRVLLVLYLAAYFATRWEFVRLLREEAFGGLEFPSRFRIPRYDHVLPVLAGVLLALVLFFLQKDLGPALVFGCLFLALYGVARRQLVLVVSGLVLMVAGFYAGYVLGYPRTIVTRVAMWLSPWENAAYGGDHVAHALWAYASGGTLGMGLGLGEPRFIPAAHTDMVLAAVGEELGFAGILVIGVLFTAIVVRGLVIALRAGSDYAFFLALGLTLSLSFPMLLIAAGSLGVFPLSGVATPFLSYGKSSMIVNLAVLGMLCGIARGNRAHAPVTAPFRMQVRVLGGVLAACAVAIVARAATVQVMAADATMARSSLAAQADGRLRYQDNPRLRQASRMLPRGTIVDRRGTVLAVTEDNARRYPLGGDTYHLLGDFRTRNDWAASNTSFEEREHERRLSGFDNHEQLVQVIDPRSGQPVRVMKRSYAELIPLWRYRHRLGHASVRALLHRPRDLRVSIDARLQTRLRAALDRQLAAIGRTRGAVVVMDAQSGDVLALVNAPRPEGEDLADDSSAGDPHWFDRARYGIYPPGSTFKLVTAAAALRADPALRSEPFLCRLLPDGRVGARVPGWSRPIRDDELDTEPHGVVTLREGVEKSCNAYFAQLALRLGPRALHETGAVFEIDLAQPDTPERLRANLPQAAYGQGEVRITPFKMARVVASIANGGRMPYGRWVIDAEDDRRNRPPVAAMSAADATDLASFMRGVVTRGTARSLAAVVPPIAGKTGTAEVQGAPSHAWFAGFAPYGSARGRRIAFAILIEHGGYGGRSAAPLAREIVTAAQELGLFDENSGQGGKTRASASRPAGASQ